MKLNLSATILLLLLTQVCSAQTEPELDSKKGKFSIYWGYNRSFYSTSTLHFNGPEFDVTFYDLEATDRPSKFGKTYFNPATITIPQYNFRMGYFLNDHFSLSLGVDHMKYVVTPFQTARFSGVISESISEAYAGSYLNQDLEIEPELLKFEHSDGFNFVSLDVEYLLSFNKESTKNFALKWNVGLGGIWVLTKTNVRILGAGLDNDFHISGFALAGKTGPRLEFKNKVFLLGEVKAGYASLDSIPVQNSDPLIGDQNISFLEYYFTVGVYLDFRRKKERI